MADTLPRSVNDFPDGTSIPSAPRGCHYHKIGGSWAVTMDDPGHRGLDRLAQEALDAGGIPVPPAPVSEDVAAAITAKARAGVVALFADAWRELGLAVMAPPADRRGHVSVMCSSTREVMQVPAAPMRRLLALLEGREVPADA